MMDQEKYKRLKIEQYKVEIKQLQCKIEHVEFELLEKKYKISLSYTKDETQFIMSLSNNDFNLLKKLSEKLESFNGTPSLEITES